MFKKKSNYDKVILLAVLEIQKEINANTIKMLDRIEELEEKQALNDLMEELCFLGDMYDVDFEVNEFGVWCQDHLIVCEDTYKETLDYVLDNEDEIETKIKAILFDEAQENELAKNDKKKK